MSGNEYPNKLRLTRASVPSSHHSLQHLGHTHATGSHGRTPLPPTAGTVAGSEVPVARSTHRAASVPGGVLVFGGAGQQKQRQNDLWLLRVHPSSQALEWHLLDPPLGPKPNGV